MKESSVVAVMIAAISCESTVRHCATLNSIPASRNSAGFVATALSWGREKDVKVVRIDIDPVQANLPRPADVVIPTGAKSALPTLLAALQKANGTKQPSRQAALDAAKRSVAEKLGALEPQRSFARVLREELPDDAIVVTDVTQMGYFIQYGMPFYQPRTCITTGYQATLGFAMPTALGAQIAFPDRKVVALESDGSGMYTLQALWTQAREKLNVVTLVFANRRYAILRHELNNVGAENVGRKALDMLDLDRPDLDWVAMARGMGVPGTRVETMESFNDSFAEALKMQGPYLIEIAL